MMTLFLQDQKCLATDGLFEVVAIWPSSMTDRMLVWEIRPSLSMLIIVVCRRQLTSWKQKLGLCSIRPQKTLANNSTCWHYSKITQKSAFIWGQIVVRYSSIWVYTSKIGFYNSWFVFVRFHLAHTYFDLTRPPRATLAYCLYSLFSHKFRNFC